MMPRLVQRGVRWVRDVARSNRLLLSTGCQQQLHPTALPLRTCDRAYNEADCTSAALCCHQQFLKNLLTASERPTSVHCVARSSIVEEVPVCAIETVRPSLDRAKQPKFDPLARGPRTAIGWGHSVTVHATPTHGSFLPARFNALAMEPSFSRHQLVHTVSPRLD